MRQKQILPTSFMRTINTTTTTDPMKELHDVVNLENQIIGVATRKEFLENPKLMRRSSHIWLENSEGEWWMQQRSRTKDIQPLHWQSACSGFVKAGASTKRQVLADAERELLEELGIKTALKLYKIVPMPKLTVGGIMVYWCMGKSDGPFRINKTELKALKSFTLQDIRGKYIKGKIKLTEPFIKEIEMFLAD